jgi:glycogen debranching enzyme
VNPGQATGEGIYAHDTRYLSELRLRIGGRVPVLLSSSADSAHEAIVDLTNPTLGTDESGVPQTTLHLNRTRLVGEGLHERIEVSNYGFARAKTDLKLSLSADFADIFEVRGAHKRIARGQLLAAKRSEGGVIFGYLGEDQLFRETFVQADPAPEIDLGDDGATLRWSIDLPPRGHVAVTVTIETSLHGGRSDFLPMEATRETTEHLAEEWRESCTLITGPHPSFNRVMEASVRDLMSLTTMFDGEPVITAGIPWYVAPFGRDALITCYEMLMLNPRPARDALRFLARYQAQVDDPERDAEPGKILHEFRFGELTRAGYTPHSPYYGTVDATPLFLILAGEYYRWTADLETLSELLPSFDGALEWMDRYGDRDGDRFLEYEVRSASGLDNQGWKDSADAVVHADGTLAKPPIALVEVQGYAYLAKRLIAEVYEALGNRDRSELLRKEATELKEAFNESFWMEEEGTYALALDGNKRQVRSVTSNPGHCLFCGIAEDGKAGRIVERLLADDMFSGWGVRTLSTTSPAYNPVSYHNGSVWPHDNAMIAAGLKRYGAAVEAEKIVSALFDVADLSRDARLPELLCGFDRHRENSYVPYPVACIPQAWAAAAPFMILEALLGISADAREGLLTLNQPYLPEWLSSLEMKNIRVGGSTISLAFTRSRGVTAVSLLERSGDARVSIHQE